MTSVALPVATSSSDARATARVSGWPTVLGILACQGLLVGLLRVVGSDLPPFTTVAYVTGACLVALTVAHVLFLRRDVPDRFYFVIVASFLVRVGVGVWHFVTFINPEYVDRPTDTNFEWDYEWLNQEMAKVAETWRLDGFLAPMDPFFFLTNKNAFLTIYNGSLYWATGQNVLTYAPWNALHSAYMAYIVIMLARRLDASSPALMWIAILIAFQPFGMISSIFWRDTVGHAWLAMGFVLMLLTRHRLPALLVATAIAAFLSFGVREPYLLIPSSVFVLFLVKEKLSWHTMLVSAGALVVGVFLGGIVLALAFRRADVAFGGLDLLGMPGRLAHAVVGPFPWYQVTYGRDLVPGAPYMIPDFAQHVLSAAVYLLVAPVVYRRWRQDRGVDAAFFFGALLFFTGLFGLAVHSSYVTIGTAFMMPLLVHVRPGRIPRTVAGVFVAFVCLNLFWWASGLGAG